MSKVLVYGVGINDADYKLSSMNSGVRVICPFYQRWTNMLKRCYSKKFQARSPTYIGCYVCDEWLIFSNFKRWMEKQDWPGNVLDKDLLTIGNKVYSPDTCAFVSESLNSFVLDRLSSRGGCPLGVHFCKVYGKLRAQCSNPFSKKNEFVGNFDCPHKAHEAWRMRKHLYACQLAGLQTDERVANALRTRYLEV